MRNFLAAYGAVQLVAGVTVLYMMLNPKSGRPHANAHPWERGGDGTKEGSDRGFDGYN